MIRQNRVHIIGLKHLEPRPLGKCVRAAAILAFCAFSGALANAQTADGGPFEPDLFSSFSETITRCQAAEPLPETAPVYYMGETEGFAPSEVPAVDPFDPTAEYPVTVYDHWADGEDQPFTAQLLPQGMIYPSYLAGRKEPRLQSVWTHEDGYGWLWDITLGGRAPLFRYGTSDPIEPEGFQIDMEGAALLRLDIERDRSLAATDYRAGLPLTYGTKHWQYKFAYYHISSHLGDEYLLDRFRTKKHYVRDELVLGIAYRPISSIRLYGEAGWAFNTGQTTDPWEFQVGAEYSPVYDASVAHRGTPFAAIHGHLFQELDFGGYLNLQVGWQWRGATNNLLRLGAEFYDGCDDQFQFHALHQRKIGFGLWYDF